MSRFVSLAGEQVADLAHHCAEPGRLSRGRALFRKGSVSGLSVVEGSVFASVRGSAGDQYETAVSTALAPPGVVRQIAQAHDPDNPESIDDLIGDGVDVGPREMDLAFDCDCADWEHPCKHAVAVILAFADRVDLDETELLRWRGVDISAPVAPPRTRPPADESNDRAAKLTELEALLGNTVVRVPKGGGSELEPPAQPVDPAMAEFLGTGLTVDPVDVSGMTPSAPLFGDAQLGPLAELGPELAKAIAMIITRLEGSTSG